MKKAIIPFNQSGSIRHGIILILIILLITFLFKLIDEKEEETHPFGFDKSNSGFNTRSEDGFFDDDEYLGKVKSHQAQQPILKPVEELEEEVDPDQLGKSSKNSFYRPPSNEEKRRADSKDSSPRLRP